MHGQRLDGHAMEYTIHVIASETIEADALVSVVRGRVEISRQTRLIKIMLAQLLKRLN
jgi:hypothetical protein